MKLCDIAVVRSRRLPASCRSGVVCRAGCVASRAGCCRSTAAVT